MLTSENITIVIATRNRVHDLCHTLTKLSQLYPSSPVLVLDNGSIDKTTVTVRRLFPNIQLVELGKNRGTAARTIGVMMAQTPLIAFNDDDSCLNEDCLIRAAEIFDACPRLGLAAARVLVGKDQQLDPVCCEMRDSPLKSLPGGTTANNMGIPVLGFLCCGAIVRRTAFLGISGFEENFGIGGEEQLLAIDLVAAGWDVRYFEELLVQHYPQNTGDRANRRQVMIRNDLWTAWLRRPPKTILAKTFDVLAQSFSCSESRRALWEAMRGLVWVLRKRRVVPPFLEAELQLLENKSPGRLSAQKL